MTSTIEGLRVLIAEDDFLIASHLGDTLTDHGASVTLVSSVSELTSIDPVKFDVAVLDQTLSDGDVEQECRRLSEAGLPLIKQSGGDGKRADDDRYVAFLGKPVDEDALIEAVSVHGRGRQAG